MVEEHPKAPRSDDEKSSSESTSKDASQAAEKPAAETSAYDFERHPDEEVIKDNVVGVLRTIFDPEIPVNIYEIGLIYEVAIDQDAKAHVRMTLTSPACPVAGSLPPEVEQKVGGAPGVRECKVELVWDPPWTMDRMSDAARLQLNL